MRAAIITHSHKIAWALLIALPVILPFIRRAGPVVLVLAACLTLVPIIMRGELRDLLRRMWTPTTMLIAAFLAWACVTLLWTPVPARGFHAVASATLMVLSGLVLIHGLERLDPSTIVRWLAPSIALGATIISVDLSTGGYLLKLIHSKPEPYRYNMVLVSLVALSFLLFRQGINLSQPLRYVTISLLLTAALVGESETALLVLIIGYAVLFLSPFVSRAISLASLALGIIAAWAVFLIKPEILNEAARLWPSLAEQGHAAERIQIWIAYSKFALAGLPWGWGVESVAHVPMTTYYAAASEAAKPWLEWLHSHNNVIQIVAETGWLGILFGVVACFTLITWAHEEEQIRPARAAQIAAITIVALVSHGFWQVWWWSVMVYGFIFLRSKQAFS